MSLTKQQTNNSAQHLIDANNNQSMMSLDDPEAGHIRVLNQVKEGMKWDL